MDIADFTPQRKNRLRLSDGRQLAWYEWGPLSGYPVIFCTGAGMSGSLGFGVSSLSELNLRLIAIDRPGLGESDPHEEKTLTTWCQDIREFLLIQKISVPPLGVGFSQGAPFAFALAASGLLKSLAIISGQDDFSDFRVLSLLPFQVKDFVQRVQSGDQDLLNSLKQTGTADGFFNLIISMSSESDKKIYDTEPFRSAYHRCLIEGFRMGPSGYVKDLINCLGPWPFEIEKIMTPVDFWYGELDANSTHSPNFGATLSKRFPNHTHVVIEGEGGSLLWTRAEEILQTLVSHVLISKT